MDDGQAIGASTRAERALASILPKAPDVLGSGLVVIDAWADGPDRFCIVYRTDYHDGVLGLRREVDAEWAVEDVARYVLWSELGEPLGSMAKTLVTDGDGISWWTGDRPEWRSNPRELRAVRPYLAWWRRPGHH